MDLSSEANKLIKEKHGYVSTDLFYHAMLTMAKVDKLWVKKDKNGYHYRNYYQTAGKTKIYFEQIYSNLSKPLEKGDKIGKAEIW